MPHLRLSQNAFECDHVRCCATQFLLILYSHFPDSGYRYRDTLGLRPLRLNWKIIRDCSLTTQSKEYDIDVTMFSKQALHGIIPAVWQEGRRIAVLPYESPKLRGEYVLVVKFCGDSHVIAGSATCHDAQVTIVMSCFMSINTPS